MAVYPPITCQEDEFARSVALTPRANSFRALLQRRVWNGIFAAGDRRAKRDLKTIFPRRDRKSETTSARNAPKAAFLLANVNIRVSEDWVVGAPGLEPGTH